MISKRTLYIQPNIKVISIKYQPIMAASAISVTENGEADAKANCSDFIEEEDENYMGITTY